MIRNRLAGLKLSPAAVVATAIAVGMLTAGLSAIHLMLTRTPPGPMVAINLKYGLMVAIPTGAVVALSAIMVGLGLRALVRRIPRCRPLVTSTISGVGVGVTALGALLVVGQGVGAIGLDWWPAISCVIGAVMFGFWSEARDRHSRP